jgi:hypothetical protein
MLKVALSRMGKAWPVTAYLVFVIGWLTYQLLDAAIEHKLFWIGKPGLTPARMVLLAPDPFQFLFAVAFYFVVLACMIFFLILIAVPTKWLAIRDAGKASPPDKSGFD